MSKRKKMRNRHTNHTYPNNFNDTAYVNSKTYTIFYNRMMEIALSRFRYLNLPDTVDERYLKMRLLKEGCTVYFDDEIVGNLCLGVEFGRNLDVYGNYTRYAAIGYDGRYRKELSSEDSVIIYANYTRVPEIDFIHLYAYRLTEILRTIDVNVAQQRTTKLLVTTEQQRLSINNFLMKLEGHEVYSLVTDGFNMEVPTVDLNTPYIADKLERLLEQTWNDFLTIMGVETYSSSKKERENTIESGSRFGDVEMERNTALKARQDGFDKVNKMFGTNIQVEFNTDLPTLINGYGRGDNIIGDLHDNDTFDN